MAKDTTPIAGNTTKQPVPPSRITTPEIAAEPMLFDLEQRLGNQAVLGLVGPAGDRFEEEADRAANAVASGETAGPVSSRANGGIQRKCAECKEEEEERIRRQPADGKTAGAAQRGPGLIVEDEAPFVGPTQMRKAEFLSAMRSAVCATADEGLAGTGRTAQGCPYIQYWIGFYGGQSAARIERAMRMFAPETAEAHSAREAIPLLAKRVRHAVDQWANTGDITGMPGELPADLMGGGIMGGLFFKGRSASTGVAADPGAVAGHLGPGRTLEAGVRGRMESAFGINFSNVRLHTDTNAAQLSDQLQARAFTVGPHVAFGAGEYCPGTPEGDALLAHELAHVVQQRTAERAEPGARAEQTTGAIEQDAYHGAFGAMTSLWAGAKGAAPRLRSGLRLSRCKKAEAKKPAGATADKDKAPACPVTDEIKSLKLDLVSKYGLASVTEERGACWSAPELKKMNAAFARVPEDQRENYAGVELRRVSAVSSGCKEPGAQGCFIPSLEKSGARHDRIEMADGAFAMDVELEKPDATVKVSRTTRTGEPAELLPSQEILLHEVGHAVATGVQRPAAAEVQGADVEVTKRHDELNAAIKAYTDAAPSFSGLTWSNPAEKKYAEALPAAATILGDVIKAVNTMIPPKAAEPTAASLTAAIANTKAAIDKAKKAMTALDKARKGLPKGSTFANTAVERALQDQLAASAGLVTALEKRLAAEARLGTAKAAEKAASAKITVASGTGVEMSRRLAEFVALVSLKKLDIKENFSGHVAENWPDHPEEAFAEMYSESKAQPKGLKKLDSDLFEFFNSPIGPKGKWKKLVDAWISSHPAK